MSATTDVLFLIGRILFGGYFLLSGINHFVKGKSMMIPYSKMKGVPMPTAAVYGSGLLLVLGGLSVVAGFYPFVGLALLALFLVGVTPQMHAYWKEEDPQARMGEQVNFLKNIALLGAVAALYAVPTPWPYGL